MKEIRQRTKKQYGKNLWGLTFLIGGGYLLLQSHPTFLIPMGIFLIFEHIWNWGNFTFYDFVGHEYLGLFFIVVGTLIKPDYTLGSLFGFILIFLGILINLNTDKEELSKELKWFTNKRNQ